MTDPLATQRCSTSKAEPLVASGEDREGIDVANDNSALAYSGSTSLNHCYESRGNSYRNRRQGHEHHAHAVEAQKTNRTMNHDANLKREQKGLDGE
jgi:hypothetical protein